MLSLLAVALCLLLQPSTGADLLFPADFKFGAATAAYQIEGGWDADGKGENIWDRFVHEKGGHIADDATGDVAADSYHLWREDVKAAAEMGLQSYRFSINWPRILPTGFTNKFNKVGAKYYSDLIDSLLAEGIEPIVTLYHWELPVKMQDLGGWANPMIVKWFGDYARVIYSLYADRVKIWLTINEPNVICDYSFNSGIYAPGILETEFGPFLCNKNVLLAHANAYRIFDQEFRPKYEGRISLANNLEWIEPLSSNDTELAELGRLHQEGRYSYPIFSKTGGWPPSIEKVMLEYSLKQGYNESRLPAFTAEEIEFIKDGQLSKKPFPSIDKKFVNKGLPYCCKVPVGIVYSFDVQRLNLQAAAMQDTYMHALGDDGSADFYGIIHYATFLIRPLKPGEDSGPWFVSGSPEINAKLEVPPDATFGIARILPVYPKGIRRQLVWLKQQYGDIDILIAENGFSSSGYQLNDFERVNFISDYLEQVLLAIKVDNVSVIGYNVWSLIDNFEWMGGYTSKFGLYEVDFDDPNRPRTGRLSSQFYACVIKYRSLDVPDLCYKMKSVVNKHEHRNKNSGAILANREPLLCIISLVLGFFLTFI